MQIGSSTSAYSGTALSQMHSKLFSSIDADGDGKMTLEELESSQATSKSGKAQSSTSASSSASASAAERFLVMDTDGDGSVTEDEGLAFFTSSMSSETMGGMLQAQEAGQQEGTRPSGPPPAGGGGQEPQTFDELDINQDGTVSLDEMLASSESEDSADTSMIEELFSHMDADGDGSVTEDEKTAFDEAMKANGPPKGPPPQMTEATSATSTTSDTATSDETASKIANLTAQWMTSVYQALSEGTKQTSTTSVAA
ncbi:EF-hand domain-containing protein [Asticcacaulis sp. ZE23SCel15]|uniref:EF-hand domain-containing protein n=1 Tax=Asticcacaulis sp. ZE23SCel15 TaxID=3059027 RepID=UPI00265FC36C|nr:EF-hand domain-containing protein [Asticcacaulis sp. ZE23SCel15]WKL58759.1 EF-hand domain-containing protein [Asticcacaulis sp. ZE23SCel15]